MKKLEVSIKIAKQMLESMGSKPIEENYVCFKQLRRGGKLSCNLVILKTEEYSVFGIKELKNCFMVENEKLEKTLENLGFETLYENEKDFYMNEMNMDEETWNEWNEA